MNELDARVYQLQGRDVASLHDLASRNGWKYDYIKNGGSKSIRDENGKDLGFIPLATTPLGIIFISLDERMEEAIAEYNKNAIPRQMDNIMRECTGYAVLESMVKNLGGENQE